MRCATCKYWERKKLENTRFGKCSCEKFIYQSESDGPTPTDVLKYWDGEDYYADFCTGEQFGCIHHAAVVAMAGLSSCAQGHVLVWDEMNTSAKECPEGTKCQCGAMKVHWIRCPSCGMSKLTLVEVKR